MNGYVQLRRGLLEHLIAGRMTSDEGIAFTVCLMKANHKTGAWKGNGKVLAQILHWCIRKGQEVLASLNQKGYLQTHRSPGMRGSTYIITVSKFHNDQAHQDAPNSRSGAPGCASHRGEVLLKRIKLQIPRTPRAGSLFVPKKANQDYQRRQAAKQQRLALERAGIPRDRRYDGELKLKKENNAIDEWLAKQRAAGHPPMTDAQFEDRRALLRHQAEEITRSA